MKLGVIPENLAERLALWFGIPPPGIMESWLGIMVSRAVIAATKLAINDAELHRTHPPLILQAFIMQRLNVQGRVLLASAQ